MRKTKQQPKRTQKTKNKKLEMVTSFMLRFENGHFDQNRLLTSKDEESLVWANNLFKNFKNENK